MTGIFIAAGLLIAMVIVLELSTKDSEQTEMRVIASEVKLNKNTPTGVLKEQFRKGNINREVYETFVSEKYGLNIA